MYFDAWEGFNLGKWSEDNEIDTRDRKSVV